MSFLLLDNELVPFLCALLAADLLRFSTRSAGKSPTHQMQRYRCYVCVMRAYTDCAKRRQIFDLLLEQILFFVSKPFPGVVSFFVSNFNRPPETSGRRSWIGPIHRCLPYIYQLVAMVKVKCRTTVGISSRILRYLFDTI
ncbi:unnamed protein product, partial [Trichogramma brassicae]